MKKYTNSLAVVAGRKLGSQEPLDDRLTWDTVAELTTAVSNKEYYSWYNGMQVYVGDNNQHYVWCSTTEAGSNANVDASANLLASNATYPSTSGLFDAAYAGLDFNFYPFTPPTHIHDDRYYTESEVDTLLAGKAASSHEHLEADITDLDKYCVADADAAFAPISHTHDDRYYTETEVDGFLNDKLDTADVASNLNTSTTTLRFNSNGHGEIYDSPLSPSAATALTIDTTGAVAGAIVHIWSNAASEPTVTGTSCTISITDGKYTTGSLNLIRLKFLGLTSGTYYFSKEYIVPSTDLNVTDGQLIYTAATNTLVTNKRFTTVSSSGGGITWDPSSQTYKIITQLTENTTITIEQSAVEDGDEFTFIIQNGSAATYTCSITSTGSQQFAIEGGTWNTTFDLAISAHTTRYHLFRMVYSSEANKYFIQKFADYQA